jgi:UDP-glucuronate 4-epimerase
VRPLPISPYGVTKLTCEALAGAYAESFGLEHVGLRYFTVYGPRQRPDMAFTRVARALAEGKRFTVYGAGDQTRDATYVGDAVSATLAAMERAPAGAVYNVGGGSETSLNEVISVCERLSGRRLDTEHTDVQRGDVRRTAADTSRIRTELGWRPETGLEDGLRTQLVWAGVAAAG